MTLSAERRPRILEIARRHGVLVLEDDPYGLLGLRRRRRSPSLHSHDPEGVVYLGLVLQDLRARVPGRLGRRAARRTREARARQRVRHPLPERVRQLAVADLPRGPRLAAARSRSSASSTGSGATPCSTRWPTSARARRWTTPGGGFYVWVTLPEGLDAKAMLPRAVTQRVAYVPGTGFYADGQGRRPCGSPSATRRPERIREGVRRLAAVVEAETELRRALRRRGGDAPADPPRARRRPDPTSPDLPDPRAPTPVASCGVAMTLAASRPRARRRALARAGRVAALRPPRRGRAPATPAARCWSATWTPPARALGGRSRRTWSGRSARRDRRGRLAARRARPRRRPVRRLDAGARAGSPGTSPSAKAVLARRPGIATPDWVALPHEHLPRARGAHAVLDGDRRPAGAAPGGEAGPRRLGAGRERGPGRRRAAARRWSSCFALRRRALVERYVRRGWRSRFGGRPRRRPARAAGRRDRAATAASTATTPATSRAPPDSSARHGSPTLRPLPPRGRSAGRTRRRPAASLPDRPDRRRRRPAVVPRGERHARA